MIEYIMVLLYAIYVMPCCLASSTVNCQRRKTIIIIFGFNYNRCTVDLLTLAKCPSLGWRYSRTSLEATITKKKMHKWHCRDPEYGIPLKNLFTFVLNLF